MESSLLQCPINDPLSNDSLQNIPSGSTIIIESCSGFGSSCAELSINLEEYFYQLLNFILKMSKQTINAFPTGDEDPAELDFKLIVIAILVIFASIALIFFLKKKRAARTDILLTGLCDSGKTLLFSQLIYSQPKETFTSIAENVGDFALKGTQLHIVDLPGHERLRSKFFDQYKNSAKAIVYVVDSVTFQKDIRDVADFLYTILADSATSSIPVLLLCNKQDETLAKGSSVVKSTLEKEINLVRTTRLNQLQSVDNSVSSNIYLGKQGKDFEFSHLSQPVEVLECSAQARELKPFNIWLERFI